MWTPASLGTVTLPVDCDMIRFLKFPDIPADILARVSRNFDEYNIKVQYCDGVYKWSDDFTEEILPWCRANICETMHWGFQIMRGDVPMHKDFGTETKLVYLIQSGGANVKTNFYADDGVTVTHSYVIPTNQWHILKATSYHSVDGVEPGQIRFSLTGRIFPE